MDVVLSVMLPSFGMKGENDILSKTDLASLLNWNKTSKDKLGKKHKIFKIYFLFNNKCCFF